MKLDKSIYIVGGGLIIWVLALTIIRAWVMDFTYDESYSYVYHGRSILQVFKLTIANNHLLNSLFLYLIGIFFPFNEFVLRIPNLLSAFIFSVTLAYIAKDIFKKNYILWIGSILVLLSNYMLFEIFSLARGYGIAAGLLAISMYFLYKYLKTNNKKDIYFCIYWAILATCAQLVSFFILTSILICYFLSLITQGKKIAIHEIKNYYKKYLAILGAVIVFLLWGGIITRKNAPIYSSKADGLSFLLDMGEYLMPTPITWGIVVFIISIGLTVKTYCIILNSYDKTIPGNDIKIQNSYIFSNVALNPNLILITSIGLVFLANFILNRGMITGREITPFSPLLFLCICINIKIISEKLFAKKSYRQIYSLAILFFGIYCFVVSINLTRLDRTRSYELDFNSLAIIKSSEINKICIHKKDVGPPILEFYNYKNSSDVKYCSE